MTMKFKNKSIFSTSATIFESTTLIGFFPVNRILKIKMKKKKADVWRFENKNHRWSMKIDWRQENLTVHL